MWFGASGRSNISAALDGNGVSLDATLLSSSMTYSDGNAPILDNETAPSFLDPMKSAGEARSDGFPAMDTLVQVSSPAEITVPVPSEWPIMP